MVWNALTEGLAQALTSQGIDPGPALARLELAIPRDPSHGDWTTNLAMVLGKELKRPPRAIAEALKGAFPLDPALFSGVEVAGPGFLNFRYAPGFLNRLP